MSNIQSLLGQFLGGGSSPAADGPMQAANNDTGSIVDRIPGGLVGGAAAGGIMALLMGNKKARKFAGKAAGYGGAAVMGGLAYRALQNWQTNSAAPSPHTAVHTLPDSKPAPQPHDARFELALIKAMIAAAKADGHIDNLEQERIFKAIEQMELSTELKALVFDLLRQPIPIEDITRGIESLEQKAEIYLASCMAIDPDDSREMLHLEQLSLALRLPPELAQQLRSQAQQHAPDTQTRLAN